MSFTAKYHGNCASCGGDIEPGQEIEQVGTHEYQHVLCFESDLTEAGLHETVCDECFLIHPEGACDS